MQMDAMCSASGIEHMQQHTQKRATFFTIVYYICLLIPSIFFLSFSSVLQLLTIMLHTNLMRMLNALLVDFRKYPGSTHVQRSNCDVKKYVVLIRRLYCITFHTVFNTKPIGIWSLWLYPFKRWIFLVRSVRCSVGESATCSSRLSVYHRCQSIGRQTKRSDFDRRAPGALPIDTRHFNLQCESNIYLMNSCNILMIDEQTIAKSVKQRTKNVTFGRLDRWSINPVPLIHLLNMQ